MQVSCTDLEWTGEEQSETPPPSQFPRLCDNQDPPSTGEKYMICTWVFSGIYNPSRMALYGVHT